MRRVCSFGTVLLVCASLIGTASAGVTLSIDIQESPIPDLSRISNVYLGDASCVYAFLAQLPHPSDQSAVLMRVCHFIPSLSSWSCQVFTGLMTSRVIFKVE
jgi:hypothetical protein